MRADHDWTPSAPSVRRRVATAAIGVMALTLAAGAGSLLRAEPAGPMLVAPTTISTLELDRAAATPVANAESGLDLSPVELDFTHDAADDARPDDADAIALPAGVDPDEIRWFNGRPIRPVRMIPMRVTAYSPDERSCGAHADGVTASGYSVWTNDMKMVAADTRVLPFGALVSIDGYHDGEVVPVLDRGGKIKGRRLDVLYPTHAIARQWGVQNIDVIVWEYADGEPNGFRTNHRQRR